MTFYLNGIIDLCLIFAVWRLSTRRRARPDVRVHRVEVPRRLDKELSGKLDKMYVMAKVSEKLSYRAFNLASSANLAVMGLQKALAVPRFMTKHNAQQNLLAKEGVDKIFSTVDGGYDWLRPVLSDEELELLDEAQRQTMKARESNGS